MSLIVGGLHSNAIQITKPTFTGNSSNLYGHIYSESYEKTLLSISTGYNNFSLPFYSANVSNPGEFSLNVLPGIYTIYTKRSHWSTAVQNIFVNDLNTEVSLIQFPMASKVEFGTVLNSNNNSLSVLFDLNHNNSCHINLTYPRCGGTRLIYLDQGEILITSEISASYYLVYAIGENFSQDSLTFYSKKYELPHLYLQGRSNTSRIWLLYCLDGNQGIQSIKILDIYINNDQLKENLSICEEFYSN